MNIAPKQEFIVRNQGLCMTPTTIKVVVHWVDGKSVWYYKEDDPRLRSTSLERFIDIVKDN